MTKMRKNLKLELEKMFREARETKHKIKQHRSYKRKKGYDIKTEAKRKSDENKT